MQLIMTTGVIKNGAYFGEDGYEVWEGEPQALPLNIVKEAMEGLDDEYPVVFEAEDVRRDLADGGRSTAAQDPTDLLGQYAICEFHWEMQE